MSKPPKKHYRYSIKINDALVLLEYLDKNHPEEQSVRSLADATGIGRHNLWDILDQAHQRKYEKDSILHRTANRYGYEFQIYSSLRNKNNQHSQKGMIIDAVYRGYSRKTNENRLPEVNCPDCHGGLPGFLYHSECIAFIPEGDACGWQSADMKIGRRKKTD